MLSRRGHSSSEFNDEFPAHPSKAGQVTTFLKPRKALLSPVQMIQWIVMIIVSFRYSRGCGCRGIIISQHPNHAPDFISLLKTAPPQHPGLQRPIHDFAAGYPDLSGTPCSSAERLPNHHDREGESVAMCMPNDFALPSMPPPRPKRRISTPRQKRAARN